MTVAVRRGEAGRGLSAPDGVMRPQAYCGQDTSCTGALIFNAGIFAQVLEGTRRDLESTFERIQRDERHGEVQVLALEVVQGRGFPSRSMASPPPRGAGPFLRVWCRDRFRGKAHGGERIFGKLRTIAMQEEDRAA